MKLVSGLNAAGVVSHVEENPLHLFRNYLSGDQFTVTVDEVQFTGRKGQRVLNKLQRAKQHGYSFKPFPRDGYCLMEKDGAQFIVDSENMYFSPVDPHIDQYYSQFNITDKAVLDVGGCFGETALKFLQWGASHVTVYEFDEERADIIREAAALNGVEDKITVNDGGVGDGCYPWAQVLNDAAERAVKLAKVDCEGCEEGLLEQSVTLLRSIPYWVMEAHSRALTDNLVTMFCDAGFTVTVEETQENPAFVSVITCTEGIR